MYKATNELIKNRDKFSQYPIKQVLVERRGGGIVNDCFKNAVPANVSALFLRKDLQDDFISQSLILNNDS